MNKTLLIVGAGLSCGSLQLPVDNDFLYRKNDEIKKNFFLKNALDKLYPDSWEQWKNYRLEFVWSEIFANLNNPKIILVPDEIVEIYQNLRKFAEQERSLGQVSYYSFFQYKDDENRTPYEYLFKFAEWELTKLVHETYSRLLSIDKKEIYKKLINFCKQSSQHLEIVSFNYDTLLEQSLESYYYQGFDYQDKKKLEGIKLIKPHGSVNWLEKIDLNPAVKGKLSCLSDGYLIQDFGYQDEYLYRPGIVGLIDKKFPDKRSDFIPFTAALRQSVEEANSIIIVGYSFPSGDRHVRGMLRYAKEHRLKDNKSPIEKLSVICPLDSSHIETFQKDLNDLFHVNNENIHIFPEKWENSRILGTHTVDLNALNSSL